MAPTDTIRIDAHHHVWRLLPPDERARTGPGPRAHDWLNAADLAPIRRDFTLRDLASAAAAAAVDRTVLVQVVPEVEETADFLSLSADEGAGLVAGVVGWVDLTDPGVADVLAALRAGPGGDLLVGARHLAQGEPDPRWLARPDVRRGLRAVAEAGLAYDLLTLVHQLPAAIETVRALPGATFVLDHLSKPPIAAGVREPWASHLRELAAEPNVACKLSGMVTEADRTGWTVADLRPYADAALDAFGPSRVMFGSDWPVCLLAGSYEEVVAAAEELTAGLTRAERDEVFGGTAARVYRLPGGRL
ncbi:amidohydrolase family protein [Saccharothrix longispora]|uniref:amidohydrolase family protein n=1 Tax=Saccharothrix longispora TaxID=33920 RepID=UPI0028FDBFAD|nr:amidohydrolase family protein [Saccharothrix longispora]MDU0290286.1 amidohydrolase family protein [Saccharothrix longispora]